jgi:hypothetical protein
MKRLAIVATVVAALALASVALASASLVGKYHTKIHSGPVKGSWTLKFSKSSVGVTENGKSIGHDPYSVKGNQVTFGSGTSCTGSGTYKFSLSKTKLKFTLVKDSCAGRKAVLSHTFTKVS